MPELRNCFSSKTCKTPLRIELSPSLFHFLRAPFSSLVAASPPIADCIICLVLLSSGSRPIIPRSIMAAPTAAVATLAPFVPAQGPGWCRTLMASMAAASKAALAACPSRSSLCGTLLARRCSLCSLLRRGECFSGGESSYLRLCLSGWRLLDGY